MAGGTTLDYLVSGDFSDEARLVLQVSEGLQAGQDLLFSKPIHPEPLVKPKRVPDPFDDDPLVSRSDATADA